MTDDQRRYSDEEFAHILRSATEQAARHDAPISSSAGLTLAEIQSAAAQVGIDPLLVAQAARQLSGQVAVSPLERLIGGPLRHVRTAHIPIALNAQRATRLLSDVRITEGHAASADAGHASAQGVTWHDSGELQVLTVTARSVSDGTDVSVALDRRGTLVPVMLFAGFGVLASALAGMTIAESLPGVGIGAGLAGAVAALAVARGYWTTTTRTVRARLDRVMDTMSHSLDEAQTADNSEPSDT